MEIKKISNNQDFASAYACINGEWVNLARSGRNVSIKAIRKNVESHSFDYFLKSYRTDKKGNVHIAQDKEFNSIIKKIFNKYKKTKTGFETILKNSNTYINYHEIDSSTKTSNKIHLILTGKEAVKLSQGTKKENGQFIRSLFKKADIDLEDRSFIAYNYVTKYPEDSPIGFKKKYGLCWYEQERVNEVIKDAKKDAELCKKFTAAV